MATLFESAGITAHRAHQAGASCAGSLPGHSAHCHQPNWALQGTLPRLIALRPLPGRR